MSLLLFSIIDENFGMLKLSYVKILLPIDATRNTPSEVYMYLRASLYLSSITAITCFSSPTLLAKDHPLRNAGVAGFVYGTNVDVYVKGEDGKPLSQSRIYKVPANYNERPLKQRCSLVMIDENSQELARGNKEIKELIKSLKEHGLKIAKQKDNFISKIFKSIK